MDLLFLHPKMEQKSERAQMSHVISFSVLIRHNKGLVQEGTEGTYEEGTLDPFVRLYTIF